MKKKKLRWMFLKLSLSFLFTSPAFAQGLLISEVLANPTGTDSPFEYVELIATQSIDFSVTPYTVIACNNGTANSNGWIAGGTTTYGFSITSGTVSSGNVIYVGGSSMAPTGTKLRAINTGTTAGDRFGAAASGGVFGNGGTNADGIAVFNENINTITASSVPIDAIFYGTGIGTALVSGGSAGYQLPINDRYAGGKLQTTSFIAADPLSAELIIATGTFNTASLTFTTPRTWSKTTTMSSGTSSVTLESVNMVSIVSSQTSLNFSTSVGTPSDAQNYTIQGVNLTSSVLVTAPDQFEVSASESGPFSSSISFSAPVVNAGNVTIYIRYNPLIEGSHSGNISHSSGSTFTSVSVTGSSIGFTPIYTIQGNGAASAFDNSIVVTKGVVTADFQASNQLSGFFIQSFPGDGDPSTSDGIFVYDNSFGVDVAVGDLVQVSGEVDEFNGTTEIKNIVFITKVSSENSIAVSNVSLPVTTTSDWEKYEGMYVQIGQTLTVSENYRLGRYGELTLSSDGRLINPTNEIDPNDNPAAGTTSSGTSNVAAVTAQLDLNSRRSIILNDASSIQNPAVVPFLNPADSTLRGGTTVTGLTGILDYSFGTYRIQPTAAPAFSYASRPAVPTVGNSNVKIASFNVLNYFNGDGSGGGFPTARGANTAIEFGRQRTKIINAIKQLNADVIGLMEMENDGDGVNSAIADLVTGLNTATAPGTYAYINDPVAPNGNTGTDAIKVAIIYKPSVVTPQGLAKSDVSAINNRPPVAQTFSLNANNQIFTFVVNHFKSKSSSGATGLDADQLDGQGAYNDRRKAQANQLLTFIADLKTSSGDQDVITVGDYNAYEQEDPIDILAAGGLKNLITGNYSYVFDGQAGSLDHVFASNSLFSSVTGAQKWHINADEPLVKDYNQEFNPAYVYSADAFRSSDHDPVLVGLNLQSACLPTTSTTNIDACTSYTWNGTTYTASGVYTFQTSNAAGCDSTAMLNLTIHALPITPSITANNPLSPLNFCPNTSKTIKTNTTNNSYTYLWSTGETTPTITITTYGNYSVTVTDAYGCSASSGTVAIKNCFAEDFTNDGIVDVNDFLLFAPAFGYSGNLPQDLDGDGTVDVLDFLIFAPTFNRLCDCPQ